MCNKKLEQSKIQGLISRIKRWYMTRPTASFILSSSFSTQETSVSAFSSRFNVYKVWHFLKCLQQHGVTLKQLNWNVQPTHILTQNTQKRKEERANKSANVGDVATSIAGANWTGSHLWRAANEDSCQSNSNRADAASQCYLDCGSI